VCPVPQAGGEKSRLKIPFFFAGGRLIVPLAGSKVSKPIERKTGLRSNMRLRRAPLFSDCPPADGRRVPFSKAMSSWAIVPMKASGNQLSVQTGDWNSSIPLRHIDCRGRGVRIFAPADVADRQAVESFDAPPDIDIARAAFLCRAGPRIVDAYAPEAIGVFQEYRGKFPSLWGNFVQRVGPDAA